MSRKCEICGKGPVAGNKVSYRGKAKHLGGVGIKKTGITKRVFRPNLQRVRVKFPSGSIKRIKICTRCMRSGRVEKICS